MPSQNPHQKTPLLSTGNALHTTVVRSPARSSFREHHQPEAAWQCCESACLSKCLPLFLSPHANFPQFPRTSPRLGLGASVKHCLDILAVNLQETRGRPARKKKKKPRSLKQAQDCCGVSSVLPCHTDRF